MMLAKPSRVLITGGHELGGLASFAEGLAVGFQQLGIPTEVIPPLSIYRRWRDLRDLSVLKILSTTAGFAAPFCRRAICVGHGYPCADVQGWGKLVGFLATYKLANISPDSKFVPVSQYTAIHVQQIFDISIDAVVQNPVKAVFLESCDGPSPDRNYVTYVGRLHPCKNVHVLVPPIRSLLDENPGMRAAIVGEGMLLPVIKKMIGDDPRFEFLGTPGDYQVRDLLRQTKVFISGNQTEGFGITYLEALSQGCAVVMPACGGGLEIAPELVGTQVQLMPITLECRDVLFALRRAVTADCCRFDLSHYTPKSVAAQYLAIDMERYSGVRSWLPSRSEAMRS